MAKETFVQFCPICGSKKFSFYKDDKAAEVASVDTYKCARCKNIFSFPLELPKKEAGKIKQAKLTQKLIRDTPESAFIPVGRFEVGVYWKILGAALVIIGIFYVIAAMIPMHCFTDANTITCVENNSPVAFALMGITSVSSGAYLILESFIAMRTPNMVSRTIKIGLILALVIIVLLFGIGSVAIFTWP